VPQGGHDSYLETKKEGTNCKYVVYVRSYTEYGLDGLGRKKKNSGG